jgi:hypothetical protein
MDANFKTEFAAWMLKTGRKQYQVDNWLRVSEDDFKAIAGHSPKVHAAIVKVLQDFISAPASSPNSANYALKLIKKLDVWKEAQAPVKAEGRLHTVTLTLQTQEVRSSEAVQFQIHQCLKDWPLFENISFNKIHSRDIPKRRKSP